MSDKQSLYDSILKNLKFIKVVLQNNHHTNSMEKLDIVFKDLDALMVAKDTNTKKKS